MKLYFFSIILFLVFFMSLSFSNVAFGAPSFVFVGNSLFPDNKYFSDHGMEINVNYPANPGVETIKVKIRSTVDSTLPELTFNRIAGTNNYKLSTTYVYFTTSTPNQGKPEIRIDPSLSDTITVQVMTPLDPATGNNGVQSSSYGIIPGTPTSGPNYNLVISCTVNGGDSPSAIDGICDNWESPAGFSGLQIHDAGTSSGLGTYQLSCSGDPVGCPTGNGKDIYVEYDWLVGHKPSFSDLSAVANIFGGTGKNIRLHLQQGEEIPIHRDSMSTMEDCTGGLDLDFEKLKKNYFGTPVERNFKAPPTDTANINQLTLKRQVFHYVIFGHSQPSGASGVSEVSGQDMYISLGGRPGGIGSSEDVKGTFMHELGHNLGLKHSGNADTPNCEPNYPSVMSYSRQTSDFLGTMILDYSDGDMSSIADSSPLNENAGVGAGGAGETIVWNSTLVKTVGVPTSTGGVNWDNDALPLEATVGPINLNYFSAINGCKVPLTTNPPETLSDNLDWTTLDLVITDSCGFADGIKVVEIPVGSSSPGCETTSECYLPNDLTVGINETVVWSNIDKAAHTVTSGTPAHGPSGVFDSGLFNSTAPFSHKFDKNGTYDYFCMVHPWMTGVVNVVEPNPSSGTYGGKKIRTEIPVELTNTEIKQINISEIQSLIYQINATESCEQNDRNQCNGIDSESKIELIDDLNQVINSVEKDAYLDQATKMQDIASKIEGVGEYQGAGPLIPDNTIRGEILAPVKTMLDSILDNSKPYSSGVDTDGDGIEDHLDNCKSVLNPDQIDTDGDLVGDKCDPTPNGDDDEDGVDNLIDNCRQVVNPGQEDADHDGKGDACDTGERGIASFESLIIGIVVVNIYAIFTVTRLELSRKYLQI